MFNYLNNKSFVDLILEMGAIPFIIRGNIDCDFSINFAPWIDIRVYPPTAYVRTTTEKNELDSENEIFIAELENERIFKGEIKLPEKSASGIGMALHALEDWADLLCLALVNPKINIEVQLPIQIPVRASGYKLEPPSLDRWAKLTDSYFDMEHDNRKHISGALWWYRKACAAAHYSIFDSYAAYWNCLEILCNVSGGKINKGKEVDEAIPSYLKDKIKIVNGEIQWKVKSGHILHCYNKFVSNSIVQQMRDELQKMVGGPEASQIIHHCFEVSPERNRLYQIRNDINHGNIRENSAEDYERVYLRGILLSHIVMKLLHIKLGYSISMGIDINELDKRISQPLGDE
jgi:hypothetical protein